MKYTHIRFEGEIRFPGLARNASTFNAADGFEIERDGDTVTVSRGPDVVDVPWHRVMEAPRKLPDPAIIADVVSDPKVTPAAMGPNDYTFRNPTADETAPQPARHGRRGRRQAPPE
jgi:hypothetical protein